MDNVIYLHEYESNKALKKEEKERHRVAYIMAQHADDDFCNEHDGLHGVELTKNGESK